MMARTAAQKKMTIKEQSLLSDLIAGFFFWFYPEYFCYPKTG
jgi:hypothetical protein